MAHSQEHQSIAITELMRRIGLGPEVGLRIPDWDDRSTWHISPDADITSAERETAQAVIAAFDPDAVIKAELLRRASIRDDEDMRKMMELVRTKSAAEIDKWLVRNMRNNAQARKVIGAIIKLMSIPRI